MTFITFDQPLWLKTRSLVDENMDVFVRLGGFHLLMSFLGAIGFIMSGSDLEEMCETVYAPESVKKMVSGHAFARALRAHILTLSALGIHIIKDLCPTQNTKE